ncbi:TMAO reductase system periplasmic protein TorT [Nocardioides pyridinolyticus]
MQSRTLVAAGTAVIALGLAGCGSSDGAASSAPDEATEDWFPTSVAVWPEPGFESESTEQEYSPTDEVSKAWNICASFPHLSDAYWLAADYGVIKEAERAGVNMTVVEAGGYGNLDKQIQQIEDCAQNNDAVIIGAISSDGLNPTIEKLRSEGKVVIDFINGVSSPDITAQSLISYREIASQTAEYLLEASGGEDVTVAWFPGPKGAGFAEEANKGFTETLAGSNVEVINTQWGNTDKESQSKLIEDALAANPDVNYVAGNAVAAEAAGPILRDKDLTDTIGVLAYYMTPGTYSGIQSGSVLASAADPAVLTSRIATDLAIRALEEQEFDLHVAPALQVIDKGALESWDSTTTLAPTDWSAEFSYSAN